MKLLKTIFIITAILISCLSTKSISADNEKKEVTITGYIEEIAWNDDEEPTAIAIAVSTESEEGEEIVTQYTVGKTPKGKELWDYIGEDVEAKGFILKNDDDTMTINVTSYSIIKVTQEDYDEDE